MFDTARVDREPIEQAPDLWASGYDGHYINHSRNPDIPVTLRVRWTDASESDHNGTTGQWTRSDVYVRFDDDIPSMWVLASDVKRR